MTLNSPEDLEPVPLPDGEPGTIWRSWVCLAVLGAMLLALLAFVWWFNNQGSGGASPAPNTPAVTAPAGATNPPPTPAASRPVPTTPPTPAPSAPAGTPVTPGNPAPSPQETGAAAPGQSISAPVR